MRFCVCHDASLHGNMSGLGAYMSASMAQGDFLNARMLSKGYRLVPANTITNGTDFPK